VLDRKPFQDRYNALKQEAQLWTPAWKEIQRYISPTRGFFDDAEPNQGKMIDHKTILDGHAARTLNTLASGMTSGLTSPSRPWFKLGLADKDLAKFEPVKEWLAIAQDRLMSVFSTSNIYGSLPVIYAETAGFGTGALIILRDYKDVIRARNFTIGEYVLGIGPDGRVDAFGRKFWYTAGQLIREFGIENVSDQARVAYENHRPDQKFRLIHLIEYNEAIIMGDPMFQGKKYRSVYWEEGTPQDRFLRVAGFNDFPVMAPRWGVTTTYDVYGRSPGWDCLGDVKMLQKMQRNSLIALDKVVDPPVQGDANVTDQINTLPGGMNKTSAVSPNAGLRAVYQIQPDFAAIEAKIQRTQEAIGKSFYADLFLMISQADRPNMTAREIVERHEEKLLALGPVLERLESELLDPLIDRSFNILLEDGLLPPPPQELSGVDLDVEYISMLAQAQKMVGTTGIEQMVAFIGNLAAANPQALDKLDTDEAIDHYSDALGTPPKVIRTKEEVDAIREEKAKEATLAQQGATLPAMVQGAKVLSETKMGQNSALDAIMAGTAGGPKP